MNDLITYEDRGRFIKAGKLVEVFEIEGATAEQVRALDASGWKAAAELVAAVEQTKVHLPSQKTKDEVIERLKFRAELEAKMSQLDTFATLAASR